MASKTPRLDLDPEVLRKAKRAVARIRGENPDLIDLEGVYFSDTAQLAVERFGDHICKHLTKAGMGRQNVEKGRPRRIDEDLWDEVLGGYAETYDVSRVAFLRAALALLAQLDTD